jgi:NAD(P)-dependent dehydrogenase (short-subunit alcohol dehydrogenase family)
MWLSLLNETAMELSSQTTNSLEPGLGIDLRGKVVLVTGAARGIGAAIARTVGKAGGEVVIVDLPDQPGTPGVRSSLGGHCCVVEADLAVLEEIPRLWEKCLSFRGKVDVLVNNAGIYEQAPLDGDFSAWHDSWQRTLAVNLLAPAHLCREAIRHFRQHGGGTIVNIASRAAFRGDTTDYMNYAATKGGLVSLTRTIARGLASEKILAYIIAPGFVVTPLNDEYFRTHGTAAALKEIPLGEMALPEDIATTVVFLASGLARHATGTTIDLNGASYVR